MEIHGSACCIKGLAQVAGHVVGLASQAGGLAMDACWVYVA
jgi:hypothetical protein